MTTNNDLPIQQAMSESREQNSIETNMANDERKPRKPYKKPETRKPRVSRKPDYVSIHYLRQFAGVSYPILKQLIEDNGHLLTTVHVNKSVRYSRVDIENYLKIRIND